MTQIDRRSQAAAVDWPALLARVLPHVDAFLPSIDEVSFMFRAVYGQGQTGQPPLEDLSRRLLDMGAAIVLLKMGEDGLYLRTAGDASRLATCGAGAPGYVDDWRDCRMLAPCFCVDVAGTTGAGDASIAGFLAGLLRGLAPREAILAAAAAGACRVEKYDASGIPSWQVLQERIGSGWKRRECRLRLADCQIV